MKKGSRMSEEQKKKISESKGGLKVCLVSDCEKRALVRGLCAKHFWRNKVHGSPLAEVSVGHPKGQLLTKAHKRKLSIAHRTNGYQHSEETRKKMSESLRLTYTNGRLLASTATFRNNVTGFYTSKKMGIRCQYRSKLEKWLMVGLDADKDVKYWFYEPFTIPYWHQGKQHSYFLDFAVWYQDGRIELVEVKHSSHTRQERVVSKTAAAKALAHQLGAEFKFVTEKAA